MIAVGKGFIVARLRAYCSVEMALIAPTESRGEDLFISVKLKRSSDNSEIVTSTSSSPGSSIFGNLKVNGKNKLPPARLCLQLRVSLPSMVPLFRRRLLLDLMTP